VDEERKYRFYFVPGVPYEMKYLVENEIIPKVVREYERPYIIHKTILTMAKAKVKLQNALKIGKIIYLKFIKLAYLPSPGRVRLRFLQEEPIKNNFRKSNC
jgi:nicotinamide-nucleotide amidase